jgi:dynein heavy chain
LVDETTVGEWNLQGLPSDELSIQNGIMMTRSARYPLMVDPQGQAHKWILQREAGEENWMTALNNPRLKDLLQFLMGEGKPCLIEAVEHELDPMLDPILEKQIIIKGRNKKIWVADTEMD